jgi:hypothetical protein
MIKTILMYDPRNHAEVKIRDAEVKIRDAEVKIRDELANITIRWSTS